MLALLAPLARAARTTVRLVGAVLLLAALALATAVLCGKGGLGGGRVGFELGAPAVTGATIAVTEVMVMRRAYEACECV